MLLLAGRPAIDVLTLAWSGEMGSAAATAIVVRARMVVFMVGSVGPQSTVRRVHMAEQADITPYSHRNVHYLKSRWYLGCTAHFFRPRTMLARYRDSCLLGVF